MNSFLVTDDFIKFFRQNAETVGNQCAGWVLEKTINGYVTGFEYYFDVIDAFIRDFSFFTIEGGFVPYYEEIFGKNETLHRYTCTGPDNYDDWKKEILKHNNIAFPMESSIEFGESFEIIVNYKVRSESENTNLYKGNGYGECINISFYYFPNENITKLYVNLIARHELFYEHPWQNEDLVFFNLPTNVSHNRQIFKNCIINFMSRNGFILNNKYVEMRLKENCIDEYGFIDCNKPKS